ncbi:ABC transporter ATP-binding protein [Pseudomonas sp. SWI6]|uniref:ABC transporter ATP-binding protein n=1 Tax=Pseudomonas taiwanensis TaxID=470150 RepID=A0ABR6V402_9PSED|nr:MULTISPECIES: ABC transporter ATP-binding protein [Pseudomonas]AGZ34951.1 ABC transporter-like protein [Pseudomonas sp. VLB120]AVD83555.1 ABC transporter ATP-binding protein [Pseudomonas sp. SWI6]AVD85702.1 ABC transporter ATP-binding protein [Pseudomonas sp. SWI44]MBC3475234.1 ABC transporter ATP-binding protein [Pseudomonas taiwanensis]MBC3490154.1 ABC transporter ATP-binding protein [Pseudomonas taiwanensis]
MTLMINAPIAPLACQGLSLELSGNLVLRDIDLTLVTGETLGIVGPNGSGKSSLLKVLAGLRAPASGSVQLLGNALARLPRRRIAQTLALVEQQADTLDAISVFDAVALGRTPWLSALSPFSSHDRAIVEQALVDLDAEHLRTRIWNSLSGGERQRVHIARALAQSPQVLLLDEPTNHLDIQHQLSLLRQVQALPITTLIALHDLNQALTCDRVAMLDKGRLVALGKPQDVLTPERLLSTFGVQAHYLTDPFDGARILRFRAP